MQTTVCNDLLDNSFVSNFVVQKLMPAHVLRATKDKS